jgi:hypothetical protein
VTQEDWASCVRHAGNLQEEDFVKEIGWDEILEPIVINLQDSETQNEVSDENDSDVTGDNDDDDDTLN